MIVSNKCSDRSFAAQNLLLGASRKVVLRRVANLGLGLGSLALLEHLGHLVAVSHGVGAEHGSNDRIVSGCSAWWGWRGRTDRFVRVKVVEGRSGEVSLNWHCIVE